MLRAGRARQSAELGKPAEGEVDLERRAFAPVAAYRLDKSRVQFLLLDQAEEGHLRIEVGDDGARLDLLAARQNDAGGPPVPDQNLLDGCAGADHRAAAAGGGGDRFGNRAHAAADESPEAALAGDAAHRVVEQDVGRPGGTRPAVGTDDAVGGERHLQLLGLEPFVEHVGGALGEDLHESGEIAPSDPIEAGGELQVFEDVPEAVRRELRRGDEQ